MEVNCGGDPCIDTNYVFSLIGVEANMTLIILECIHIILAWSELWSKRVVSEWSGHDRADYPYMYTYDAKRGVCWLHFQHILYMYM